MSSPASGRGGNRRRVALVSARRGIRVARMGDHAKPRACSLLRAGRADVATRGCVEGLHREGGEQDSGAQGQFWQEGYWDTYMRDNEHELKTRRYIENNPTKAKLAVFRKEWPWGSARFRDAYERLCLPPPK